MSHKSASKDRLKVFFSAPATKLPEEREIYQKIIDELKAQNCSITYDWLNDQKDYDPASTTLKSVNAIQISNVLIAENTAASTGVGGQIALARARKIPVIILNRKDVGGNGGFFQFSSLGDDVGSYEYTLDDLSDVLRAALSNIKKPRFVKFNFISTPEINQKLVDKSKKLGFSKSELLRKILEEYFKI